MMKKGLRRKKNKSRSGKEEENMGKTVRKEWERGQESGAKKYGS